MTETSSCNVDADELAGLVLGSPQEQRTCYCVNPARMAVLKGLVESL